MPTPDFSTSTLTKLGDALTVYPFGNQVATTVVTGENLWKALENGVGGNYPGDGRFPQISGFKFTFDPTKAVGSRQGSNCLHLNNSGLYYLWW